MSFNRRNIKSLHKGKASGAWAADVKAKKRNLTWVSPNLSPKDTTNKPQGTDARLKSDALSSRKFARHSWKREDDELVIVPKPAEEKYCLFFCRYGRCRLGNKCIFEHDSTKVAICRPFLRGRCQDTNCLLSHRLDTAKMPDCEFFTKDGFCNKNECPYRHVHVHTSNQEATACLDFLRGYCRRGLECPHRHAFPKRTVPVPVSSTPKTTAAHSTIETYFKTTTAHSTGCATVNTPDIMQGSSQETPSSVDTSVLQYSKVTLSAEPPNQARDDGQEVHDNCNENDEDDGMNMDSGNESSEDDDDHVGGQLQQQEYLEPSLDVGKEQEEGGNNHKRKRKQFQEEDFICLDAYDMPEEEEEEEEEQQEAGELEAASGGNSSSSSSSSSRAQATSLAERYDQAAAAACAVVIADNTAHEQLNDNDNEGDDNQGTIATTGDNERSRKLVETLKHFGVLAMIPRFLITPDNKPSSTLVHTTDIV